MRDARLPLPMSWHWHWQQLRQTIAATMKNLLIPSLLLFSSPPPVASYAAPKSTNGRAAGAASSVSVGGGGTRRAFLSTVAGAAVAFAVDPDRRALADDGGHAAEDVYFGVGCFWHVQHEFVLVSIFALPFHLIHRSLTTIETCHKNRRNRICWAGRRAR